MKRGMIGAHRGDRAHYPENTLLALQKAIEAGAEFVEFDIQLTRDGVPVLLHDATLSRTGKSDSCIFDLSFDEAEKEAIGEPERFGDQFLDVRISALTEILQAMQEKPDVILFIEIKQESIDHFGLEGVVTAVMKNLKQAGSNPYVLISDHYPILQILKQRGYPIGWVIRDLHQQTLLALHKLGPEWVIINHQRLSDSFELLRPFRWMCYEVNDISVVRSLFERGIDAIETGDPYRVNPHSVFAENDFQGGRSGL